MTQIVNIPGHGFTIVKDGHPTPSMQLFMDDLALQINGQLLGEALKLSIYTVATVPDATKWTGAMIYVSDETGGAVTAFSDGTSWRRSTDRAVVS